MVRQVTCQQALSLVVESRQLQPEAANALTGHLVQCDECRVGVLGCERAQGLMEEALRGEPPPQATAALAAHLVRCDRCRNQAEAMLQAQAILERLEMPASLSERLGQLTRAHLARQLRVRLFQTPIAWTGLAYNDSAIVLISRSQAGPAEVHERLRQRLGDFVTQERRRDDIGESAVRKLLAYHSGRRVQFDEPLDLSLVPPFTQGVLRATARIPYGEVRPYAWVAREIGRPRAARAVGQSLHINPLAPIIPCHRVIASDNSLGGYGGGVEMKRWLLRLEGYLS